MKKQIKRFGVLTLQTTLGLAITGSAFAQSSVTLYGIVDQSIRYTTNANADNDSSVQMANGAITNSRWGMKGHEDLGNGLSAIFRLENGFEPQTGKMDSNLLFGRYAYVGLSGNFGTVKMGRQTTEGFNLFGDLDPLTIGNYTANGWPYYLTQGYANNVVSYDNNSTIPGLDVGASYGFGGQAGSMSQNSYWGLRSSYTHGPFTIGGVYQQTRDLESRSQQMWGAAARYVVGPASLFVGYIGGKDSTGEVDSYLNDPSRNVQTGSFVANPRRDTIGYTGIVYQVTPAVTVTGAFYYDSMRDVNGIADNGGKRYTGVLVAEYALSKSTQVYGTVDYNKVSGGAVTELPGKSNQTGVAAGIRHMF
ncbi:porin [Paraburkholderia sp. HD33-4]|uniref:porin n=1 Tax=Paraburkholderia sp. HD33-4 TaxID=2883242 RepID=UPI001F257A55|nr:porin [Paraburkholderia sp. HD33-4]